MNSISLCFGSGYGSSATMRSSRFADAAHARHRLILPQVAEHVDYEPTDAEAAVLLAATKAAMGAAGAAGGSLGTPIGSFGGAKGGAAGGRFAARFTRPRTAAEHLEVTQDAEAVRDIARACIAEHGTLIADPDGTGGEAVWGLVGSGALDLMPALLRVDVEPLAGGGARVGVRATGREGLIKQRIAGKAVDRICDAIRRAEH